MTERNGCDTGVGMRPAARMNKPNKTIVDFVSFLIILGVFWQFVWLAAKVAAYIDNSTAVLSGFYQAGWLEICYPVIITAVATFVLAFVVALLKFIARNLR